MNKIKLIFSLSVILLIASCKKETTIKEEYNPPQPKLYGTWQVVNTNPSVTTTTYYVFPNDGKNYAYLLTLEKDGFKSRQAYAYKATENQVNFYYYLYNYTVSNDTLTLYNTPSNYSTFTKVTNPSFTPDNWMGSFTYAKTLTPPRAMNSSYLKPFGIDGDNIYPTGYNGSAYYVYKYNTVSQQYTDSGSIAINASTYFKSPLIYYGFNNNNFLWKTTGLTGGSTISTNQLNYTNTISANPNSGVIYAFVSNGSMYSGTEGSTFNQLFDFNSTGIYNVLYYKNDEFLALRNDCIVRVKISPSYQVLSVYQGKANFSPYVLSTNGVDVWLYGYDNLTSDYKLIKVNLN